MWLRQRPRPGSISFPAHELRGGDVTGMEWQGAAEVSGTEACDKRDSVVVMSSQTKALIPQLWLCSYLLHWWEMSWVKERMLSSPKPRDGPQRVSVQQVACLKGIWLEKHCC